MTSSTLRDRLGLPTPQPAPRVIPAAPSSAARPSNTGDGRDGTEAGRAETFVAPWRRRLAAKDLTGRMVA